MNYLDLKCSKECGSYGRVWICWTPIRINGKIPFQCACQTCGKQTDYYGTEEEAEQAWINKQFVSTDYLKEKESQWKQAHPEQLELF